jgi:hypothetical protein
MSAWKYASSLGAERARALSSAPPFASLVAQIEAEHVPLCFHVQECHDDSAFARPVFTVRISRELFDSFFNARSGYRGRYFESPELGEASNSIVMRSALAVMAPWAMRSVPAFNAGFVQASFLAPSAKAWLAEASLELCEQCTGEWIRPGEDHIEISNGRWEISAEPNASFGRRAPRHEKLRFFGAFLNARGDVFIPARKRDRAHQLNSTGWS